MSAERFPRRFARLLALVAAGGALAACSTRVRSPNDEALGDPCATSITEQASIIDWTKRSDAVVVGRVEKGGTDANGRPFAVVDLIQQWSGYPAPHTFQLSLSPADPPAEKGQRWVLFLVRRTDGVDAFEKLAETTGRKDLEVFAHEAMAHDVGWLRDRVQQADHVGPMISAELERIARGERPSKPFRVEYRVSDGGGSSRWVLDQDVVVQCGANGVTNLRPLPKTDVEQFAQDLRATGFWQTPKLHGTGTTVRDAEAAIQVAGLVLTYHESSIDGAPASPVLRVIDSEIAAPPQQKDVTIVQP